MTKEFVPYEQALALKALGFDEPCFGFYTYKGEIRRYTNFDGELNEFQSLKNSDITMGNEWCTAPTFSQCFRWFRDNYGLVIQYIPFELDNEEGQSILHHKHKISEYDSWRGGRRNTIETELCDDYEEAELACLRKLIEIVKNNL